MLKAFLLFVGVLISIKAYADSTDRACDLQVFTREVTTLRMIQDPVDRRRKLTGFVHRFMKDQFPQWNPTSGNKGFMTPDGNMINLLPEHWHALSEVGMRLPGTIVNGSRSEKTQ